MSSEHRAARPDPIRLMYSDWQVWAGEHGLVRVGGDFTASIEFVQRSPLQVGQEGAIPHLSHLRDNWYRAVVAVLDTTDAVVLDLGGGLRALRWIRPGEGPGDFVPGSVVEFDLSLNLNPWTDAPWTTRAAHLYDTDHRWLVRRIVRSNNDGSDPVDLEEATMDTVASSGQYCLLDCTLLE